MRVRISIYTWQTLTFDFASQVSGTAALDLAYSYDKASIFFNFGVTGAVAGAKTYYFDDVAFGGTGGGGGTFDTITFDSTAITYTLTGFGGAEDSTIVVDPAGGTNNVARVVKSAAAELWAGTTVSTGANQSILRLPFTASSTRMTVRVWSPDAGIQVRLKVEDAADPTRSVETEARVVTAHWESPPRGGYARRCRASPPGECRCRQLAIDSRGDSPNSRRHRRVPRGTAMTREVALLRPAGLLMAAGFFIPLLLLPATHDTLDDLGFTPSPSDSSPSETIELTPGDPGTPPSPESVIKV